MIFIKWNHCPLGGTPFNPNMVSEIQHWFLFFFLVLDNRGIYIRKAGTVCSLCLCLVIFCSYTASSSSGNAGQR